MEVRALIWPVSSLPLFVLALPLFVLALISARRKSAVFARTHKFITKSWRCSARDVSGARSERSTFEGLCAASGPDEDGTPEALSSRIASFAALPSVRGTVAAR